LSKKSDKLTILTRDCSKNPNRHSAAGKEFHFFSIFKRGDPLD